MTSIGPQTIQKFFAGPGNLFALTGKFFSMPEKSFALPEKPFVASEKPMVLPRKSFASSGKDFKPTEHYPGDMLKEFHTPRRYFGTGWN